MLEMQFACWNVVSSRLLEHSAGAVVGLGALGVLATKLDAGFADFFSANLVKVGSLRENALSCTSSRR